MFHCSPLHQTHFVQRNGVWRRLNCLIIVPFSNLCLFIVGGDVVLFRREGREGAIFYLVRQAVYFSEILSVKEKEKNIMRNSLMLLANFV